MLGRPTASRRVAAGAAPVAAWPAGGAGIRATDGVLARRSRARRAVLGLALWSRARRAVLALSPWSRARRAVLALAPWSPARSAVVPALAVRSPGRRAVVLVAAVAALLATAPAAGAADYCVGVTRDGCSPQPTPAAALAAATAGDRVLLGPGTFTGQLTVGAGVTLLGAGFDATRLEAATAPVLRVAGRAEGLAVTGPVRTEPTGAAVASLARVAVSGTVAATGRTVLDSTAVTAPAGATAALSVTCAELDGRGLTLAGGDHAVATGCADPQRRPVARLRSSLLAGADPVDGPGVTTAFSAHAADPDATATERVEAAGLDAAARPVPGSPLLDAGDPAPLVAPDAATGVPGEPFEDLTGVVRVADGDGNGTVRRDIGAYELQPPALPDPPGNVLVNPGAEDGPPSVGGPPTGWSGAFGVAASGADSLPSVHTGTALGAGAHLFAGSAAAPAEMLQRIDLAGAATTVDAGRATAALSGLLGGYGADADAITVTAAFRDPEGAELGRIVLGPVTPAERGNATALLPRAGAAAVPPRTRAIDVTVRGERLAGAFTDAYADRLALVLSVPGTAVPGTVTPQTPIVAGLKPFAGVSLLTAAPAFSRTGRSAVLVACASATVGRCTGTLELRGSLTGGQAPARIGRYASFSVAPGRVGRVPVRLLAAARDGLRTRSRLKARFVVTAADAQGVQRRRVVPVRLRLPGPSQTTRRPPASRPATPARRAAPAARTGAPR